MRYIIGSDEVGLGAYAGPLVVCAVAVPGDWAVPGLADSKTLKLPARLAVYPLLHELPLSLVAVESGDIDRQGVRAALIAAHTTAVCQLLARFPDADVIIDGDVALPLVPQARVVPRADGLFPAVMAASIIAKVNRDFIMWRYHAAYPEYGFDTNVGYGGNKKHTDGLRDHGVCPIHRRSYAPIKRLLTP